MGGGGHFPMTTKQKMHARFSGIQRTPPSPPHCHKNRAKLKYTKSADEITNEHACSQPARQETEHPKLQGGVARRGKATTAPGEDNDEK